MFACLVAVPCGAYALSVGVSAIVPGCGDGIIESGEQCDGESVGDASCQSLGFVSGTLSCTSSCTFDTTSCTSSSGSVVGGSAERRSGSNSSSNNVVAVPSTSTGIGSSSDSNNTTGSVNQNSPPSSTQSSRGRVTREGIGAASSQVPTEVSPLFDVISEAAVSSARQNPILTIVISIVAEITFIISILFIARHIRRRMTAGAKMKL